MIHARIPDFSQPVPARRPVAAVVIVPTSALAPRARSASSAVMRAALLGGELLSALAIIGGGMAVVGLATLL